jgi:hypothetical protein
MEQSPRERQANRLIGEKSPYLLQHAHNPVDWYPWGEEAFARARAEDKPIFLSIGYSACHWCHVMERESFDDPEAAALLNAAFVNVKVDREERPDLDRLFMNACQLLHGSGGWPLTVILTPERKPFYAATYIPRDTRFGRIGLVELVPRLRELWQQQREKVEGAAREIADHLSRPRVECRGEMPGERQLRLAFEQLSSIYDPDHGGFGSAPKFPTPHQLTFLLRYHRRTSDPAALAMVEKTLAAMRRGGVYDHLGLGFHRYATDAAWLKPHFEKMLYDQALLADAYTEAFQATGSREYQDTAREVLAYVLRDLTDPGGGFYSSEDADSEGEEGKFYLWSTAEVRALFAPEEAELFIRVFSLTDEGNFPDDATGEPMGRNIPHLNAPLVVIAERLGRDPRELALALEPIRRRLYRAREERVHPRKDDKILCDWNGLAIAALAKAARVFGEPAFARAAAKAAGFLRAYLREPSGRLLHRHRQGESGVTGFLDDYAFLAHGLIELYEATFDPIWLRDALALTRTMIAHFADHGGGGFFLTPDDAPELLGRGKEAFDGALPSGNSIAALNLLRLSRMVADPELEREAERVFAAFGCDLARSPAGYTQMLCALDFALSPAAEVVIAGRPGAADTESFLAALRSEFRPELTVILRPPEGAEEIEDMIEYLRGFKPADGRAEAYVCRNFSCHLPSSTPEEMMSRLRSGA